jgi:hypothetical protein
MKLPQSSRTRRRAFLRTCVRESLNSPRLIESPRCGAPLTGRRRTGRTCDNERKGEERREKREARREKREREEVSEEREKKGGKACDERGEVKKST